MDKYNELLDVINSVQEIILELFSSGFNTCHDFTLSEIKRLSILCESYGLTFGAESLKSVYKELSEKPHKFNYDYSLCIKEYCILNEYLLICKDKLNVLNLRLEMY